jgi:hypothetical protein
MRNDLIAGLTGIAVFILVTLYLVGYTVPWVPSLLISSMTGAGLERGIKLILDKRAARS